jgi:hypothetical protein
MPMFKRFDDWSTNLAQRLAQSGTFGRIILGVLLIPYMIVVFIKLVFYLGWPKGQQ